MTHKRLIRRHGGMAYGRHLRLVAVVAIALSLMTAQPSAAFTEPVPFNPFGEPEFLEWHAPADHATGTSGLGQVVRMTLTGDVYAVELQVSRHAATTRPLIVEVRAGDPTGPLLGVSDPVSAALIPVEPASAWVIARFATPASVTEGQDVAVVLPPAADAGEADPTYGWMSNDEDLTLSGMPELSTTSGWRSDAMAAWSASDPIRHRMVRVGVSRAVWCRVHFLNDQGPTSDIGPTISVIVGRPLEIVLLGFLPEAQTIAEFTHRETGRSLALEATVDFAGGASLRHTFGENDVGTWTAVGRHASGAPCPDQDDERSEFDVSQLAPPASPASPAPLPDTAMSPMRMEAASPALPGLLAAAIAVSALSAGAGAAWRGARRRRHA